MKDPMPVGLVIILLFGPPAAAGGEQGGHLAHAGPAAAPDRGQPLTIAGRVQFVYAPQLFTINEGEGKRELLVLVPGPLAPPELGSRVEVKGVLHPFDASTVANTREWTTVDSRTRERLGRRPVLVAASISSAAEDQGPSGVVDAAQSGRHAMNQASPLATRSAPPILVRPATLAGVIGELAGHPVRIPYARVVGIFNPRAFLIDTATRLPLVPGNRGRVLVLTGAGSLRVPPATLVASTVTVVGVARTLLGMQVSGEVPWPTELLPKVVERLEIRAAVLATSVQTAEGIELTGAALSSGR